VSHTPASEPYSAALNYVLDTFTASEAARGVIRQSKCGAVQIFGAVTKIKIVQIRSYISLSTTPLKTEVQRK
jgi:hypothetical protein